MPVQSTKREKWPTTLVESGKVMWCVPFVTEGAAVPKNSKITSGQNIKKSPVTSTPLVVHHLEIASPWRHTSRSTRSYLPQRGWSAGFVARGVIQQVIWCNTKGITLEMVTPVNIVASIWHIPSYSWVILEKEPSQFWNTQSEAAHLSRLQ